MLCFVCGGAGNSNEYTVKLINYLTCSQTRDQEEVEYRGVNEWILAKAMEKKNRRMKMKMSNQQIQDSRC